MATHLQQQLIQVRKRLRRVLWVYGLCWWLSILLGGLLVCGLLDWFLHIDDPVVRLMLAAAAIGGSLVIAWRRLWRPLSCPLSDVELALKVEKHFPSLHDRLATAVEFTASDPQVGSPQLQRDLVQATDASVSQLDLASAVDTRRLRGIGSAAGLVLVLVILLAGLRGTEASTAITRLLLPFSDRDWPRTTDLEFVTAELTAWPFQDERSLRAGRGQTIDLFVVNRRGPLPRDLRVEYRYPDGELSQQTLPVQRRTVDGREREVAHVGLLAMEEQVEFRVLGGDQLDMPWYRLDVVSPPELAELQVRLIPPDYLREEPQELPPGTGHVQGLLGTRVQWRARSQTRLAAAALRRADGTLTPLTIAEDQRGLRTEFRIDQAGSHTYAVLLTDEEGFTSSDPPQFEIRGIPDQFPETRVARPASDIQVTPQAVIRIEATVQDDLGLDRIWLVSHREASGDAPSGESPRKRLLDDCQRRLESRIDYAWELEPLGLQPGERLLFHVEAADICNLDRQQTHQSSVHVATVVTMEQKRDEVLLREAELFAELARLARTEAQARAVVADLQIQLEKAGGLQAEDRDLLRRVEFDQRRIGQRLIGDRDSVLQRGRDLKRDLADNRLQMPETTRRLELLENELQILGTEHLPAIESQLTRVRKQNQVESSFDLSLLGDRPGAHQGQELADVARHQSAVVDALEMLVGLLARWQSERDVTQKLEDVIELQREINGETTRIGQRTATRRFEALGPQEQADLARLANRQRSNERDLTEFRATLAEQHGALATDAPRRSLYQDALDQLDRAALLGRMQELAGLLESNRIGEVSRRQQDVLNDLLALQELLQEQRVTDSEALVGSLREAEAQAEKLYRAAVALTSELEQTRAAMDRGEPVDVASLAERESALSARAVEVARTLRQLQQNVPSESGRRAARSLETAASHLRRAESGAAATDHDQAVQQLDQMRRQITGARTELEREMTHSVVERLQVQVQQLAAEQQQLIEATRQKQGEFAESLRWNRAQLKQLVELARNQDALAEASDTLARSLESLEVFALAVRSAGALMGLAAGRIRDRQTDATTVSLQERARQRLLDLVQALDADQTGAGAVAPPGTGTGDAASSDNAPAIDLVQLKLIVELQEQLAAEIGEFDRLREEDERLSETQQQRLEQLAREQDVLTRVIRAVLEQSGD